MNGLIRIFRIREINKIKRSPPPQKKSNNNKKPSNNANIFKNFIELINCYNKLEIVAINIFAVSFFVLKCPQESKGLLWESCRRPKSLIPLPHSYIGVGMRLRRLFPSPVEPKPAEEGISNQGFVASLPRSICAQPHSFLLR